MIYILNNFVMILRQILYRSSNSFSTIILSQLLTIIQEEILQMNMLKRIIPITMAFLFVWLTIRCISVVTIFNAAERNIVVLLLYPVLSLINVLYLLMVESHILMMVILLAMQNLYHTNLKPGRRYTEIEPALNE